jgi:RNA ligase (TIGR02306 family)
MRKMASVQRVLEKKPIVGADLVEAYRVNGWWVVDKKDAYKVGDLVVYCEVDSWIPHHLATFLTKDGKQPKEYLGIKGERLKTAKLRGQLSQGLLLPLDHEANNGDTILNMYWDSVNADDDSDYTIPEEGYDLTSLLGIVKWEDTRYMNDSNAKGSFPSFIPKTDQERVQNILRSIENWKGMSFEVTVKRDGSSMTAFVNMDDEGVCSRNMLLRETDSSAFWHAARSLNLLEKIRSTGRNLALQGELLSQKIQGNYEKVSSVEWNCFDIWDIDNRQYLLPRERQDLCESLGIPHIKIIDKEFILDHTVDQLLEMAEGPGINPGVQREGLVLKANTSHGISFKAVSNSYLLATKR